MTTTLCPHPYSVSLSGPWTSAYNCPNCDGVVLRAGPLARLEQAINSALQALPDGDCESNGCAGCKEDIARTREILMGALE